jgi:hypothetical protein
MSLEVADARFLTIGGIDQWVMARGRVDNPLLICRWWSRCVGDGLLYYVQRAESNAPWFIGIIARQPFRKSSPRR